MIATRTKVQLGGVTLLHSASREGGPCIYCAAPQPWGDMEPCEGPGPLRRDSMFLREVLGDWRRWAPEPCVHCGKPGPDHSGGGYCPDSPSGEDAIQYESAADLRPPEPRSWQFFCPRLRGVDCGCTAWGCDPSCTEAARLHAEKERTALAMLRAPSDQENG